MIHLKKLTLALAIFLTAYSQANAQEIDVSEMKKQIDVLAEEMEKLKLGAVAEPKYESFAGLGPAASKVYGIEKGLSIGGYGEVVYSNYMDSSKKDFADAYRFILYGGYKFNDWIIMNTELEFEHAGIKNVAKADRQAEVYIEFSYLDFLLSKPFNLRTGLILMPIGLINEYHEPTVYHGVYRPEVETNIIPSTWRDIGLMAYGEVGPVKYDLAVVNGLRTDTFSDKTWIRGGRQQGAEVNASELAAVARLNYEPADGLLVGGAYYTGKADEGKGGAEEKPINKTADVSLWEVHAQYQIAGLHLRGLYANGSLDGNDDFNAHVDLKKVGKNAEGWYLETAYDILPLISSGSEKSLTPFVRYEKYDTNKDVIDGVTRDKTLERTVITAGLGFKPHPNVIIKADYQSKDTASGLPSGKGTGKDENKIDQFNLGVGFIF